MQLKVHGFPLVLIFVECVCAPQKCFANVENGSDIAFIAHAFNKNSFFCAERDIDATGCCRLLFITHGRVGEDGSF